MACLEKLPGERLFSKKTRQACLSYAKLYLSKPRDCPRTKAALWFVLWNIKHQVSYSKAAKWIELPSDKERTNCFSFSVFCAS